MAPHHHRRSHRHSSHPPPPPHHHAEHGPHHRHPRHDHGHEPPRRHLPSSAIRGLLRPERLDALLAPWVPEEADRAFVVRCILDEGPIHHRGASYALLSLLGLVLERLPDVEPPAQAKIEGDSVAVPLRLPPHLEDRRGEDQSFPLRLPLGPLAELAPRGSGELEAIVDCLLDGPPHHTLANAAMVTIIGALLERLPKRA